MRREILGSVVRLTDEQLAGPGARLEVVRKGDRSGFWIWRQATYQVLSIREGGRKTLVVEGRFHDHGAAVRAARAVLRER